MNYILLPKVGFRLRSFITIFLFIVGLLLQIASRNFLAGVIFIILAGLFHIAKGIKIKRPTGGKIVWRSADDSELEKVKVHLQRLGSWQGMKFEGRIIVVFVVGMILIVISPLLRSVAIFIWDFAILFAPIFLTGSRSAWEPPDLRTKVKNIKDLVDNFPWQKHQVYSYLLEFGMMKKLDGSYPFDVRIKISRKDQHDKLLGIQGQYSINKIGSRAYPYFYVVIVGKEGINLRKQIGRIAKYTLEFEKDEGVEVAVIRQHTTKTSGYHTPLSTQVSILKTGIEIFERVNAG